MEAVQRKIITVDQMESVMALSRTLSASGDGSPDLTWISAVHGAAAMLAVVSPAIYLLSQQEHLTGVEIVIASVACALGSLGLSRASKALGLGPIPESIFIAGGAVFAFGIGAGICDMLCADAFGHGYSMWMTEKSVDRWRNWLAGDFAMVLAALALWRFKRAAPLGAPVALALLQAPVLLSEISRWTLMHGNGEMAERDGALWIAVMGVVSIGLAKLWETRGKTQPDVAFWLMSLPIVPMGIAGMIRMDHEAVETFGWVLFGLVVGALGLRWNRRSLLAAGAMSVVVFPAFGAAQAHAGENVVLFVLVISVVLVAAAAAGLRRHYVQRWMNAPDARDDLATVWM